MPCSLLCIFRFFDSKNSWFIYFFSITLNQTEKGFVPPIEHIGYATHIKEEMGTEWKETHRMSNIHYPWRKSGYFQDRKRQLQHVIDELDPHQPVNSFLESVLISAFIHTHTNICCHQVAYNSFDLVMCIAWVVEWDEFQLKEFSWTVITRCVVECELCSFKYKQEFTGRMIFWSCFSVHSQMNWQIVIRITLCCFVEKIFVP